MTMNHISKKIHDLTEDRLSSLPKNVIDTILLGLPLREAVRTSILSRAWRYEWSNLPVLVFDKLILPLPKEQPQTVYNSKLVKIIDQVLLLHRGPIHKFMLSVELESSVDIDRWVLFVSRNGIRELILHIFKGQRYKVPSCLFSCKGITHLTLYQCSLTPLASSCGFSNVRALSLQYVDVVNNELNNLISNCPVLRVLQLKYIGGCTLLKLCAPNLFHLDVASAFEDICFEKTPVLTIASIQLMKSGGEYQSLANGAKCTLIHRLVCLPRIRILKLVDRTYPILTAAGDVPQRFLLTKCKLLRVSFSLNFKDTQQVLATLCIFRSSPCLQKVDIKSLLDETSEGISVENFWEAKENSNCMFSKLQFLNVSEYRGTTSELQFVEFVLANAPALEIVKIEVKEDLHAMTILKKLLRFRRISRKAEILVPD